MKHRPKPHIDRREFLKSTTLAGAALAVGARAAEKQAGPLPTRVLGRTGEKVTILGLGTAPIGEGPPSVQEGIKIFSEVLDRGVNYVDTARGYGNAEEALGHVIPKRRDDLFVVTKCWTDSAAGAEKSPNTPIRHHSILPHTTGPYRGPISAASSLPYFVMYARSFSVSGLYFFANSTF